MTPLVAHADWSMHPRKRWMCVAVPAGRGWRLGLERADRVDTILPRLRQRAGAAPVALGIDAPIGLPAAYRRGQTDFPAFLRALTPDSPFFVVADAPSDISPDRPFYPRRAPPGVRRQHLLDGLGLKDPAHLLRCCERKLGTLPAASPMFWTLGANQVGKGAICLWRDLLLPALHGSDPPSLWPFDGSLAELLQPGRTAIAEVYPAAAMRQIDLGFKGSKRRQSDRRAIAPTLSARLHELDVVFDPALSAQLDDGFGPTGDGEDRFDSLIGLLRMLQVIRDPALDHRPAPGIRRWEGWILGRPVSTS